MGRRMVHEPGRVPRFVPMSQGHRDALADELEAAAYGVTLGGHPKAEARGLASLLGHAINCLRGGPTPERKGTT